MKRANAQRVSRATQGTPTKCNICGAMTGKSGCCKAVLRVLHRERGEECARQVAAEWEKDRDDEGDG